MNQVLFLACISIAIGILCGIVIIIWLKVKRRQQVADSLARHSEAVGLFGTVEVPFNAHSRGKICLNIRGTNVDFVAVTDEPISFNKGEQVLVVDRQGNQVWVVSQDFLKVHSN